MPTQPPKFRPSGWKPYVKQHGPGDQYYGTQEWKTTRERVKRRDGYRCRHPNCQTPDRGCGGRLIVNHVVARGEGGSDDDSNLITFCPPCDNRWHSEKGHGPGKVV